MARTKGSVMLNPQDPFHKLLIPIIELHSRKAEDYATPDDLYANFRRVSDMLDLDGYTPLEDCLAMVARKLGRIVSLRGSREANETVGDSIDDLIVYAVLLKGLYLEENA